jgi:general stress protein 26
MLMRMLSCASALLFVLGIQVPLSAQVTPRETPARAQVIAAARAIIEESHYCTFVTIGPDGHPQARVVDPFPPDSAFTIWIATNPATRKVREIDRDPRVTLLCFNEAKSEYVTVIGTAARDTSAAQKAGHWKSAWAALYRDENRGDDYLLLRLVPSRLEVSSRRPGMSNDPKTWLPVMVEFPK